MTRSRLLRSARTLLALGACGVPFVAFTGALSCALAPEASALRASHAQSEGSALVPRALRCEYLTTPLNIHEHRPRLSWILVLGGASDGADEGGARPTPVRGEFQTAYQVLVASTPELLRADRGDLWDSGRVASSDSAQIEYAGVPLGARRVCHWKVRVWDQNGDATAWSEPARWEMGLLAPDDWEASWIGAGPAPDDGAARGGGPRITRAIYQTLDGAVERDVTERAQALLASEGPGFVVSNDALGGDPAYGSRKRLTIDYTLGGVSLRAEIAENARANLASGALPYLRRGFTIEREVASARLYATALGVYELRLNGARVGDLYLAPGWTDYRKRVRYQAYDVTGQLRRGENVLGALVGPGWYSGHVGLFHAYNYYGTVPALLSQLEITYTDGTTERIVSDDRWKRHAGPILVSDMLKGEIYDASRAIDGWDAPGLDDSAWGGVGVLDERRTLEGQVSEPIRVIAELPAIAVSEPAPGRWTFDLGQNMVGVVRLRVRAPRGTVLTLRHGEILNPDGTVYTANLRAADSTDTYLCAGVDPATGEAEVWQPRFTFHGFRYVEITGLPSDHVPTPEMVTGVVLSSDMPMAGRFMAARPEINRLQSNIVWGMRGNYLDIPTDCPQRDERMGWTADTQVFLPTAAMNADVAAFMTKWMVDLIDAQRPDGAHSDVAPATFGLNYGTPAWADAGTIVPWQLYEMYGDRRILERSIDSMIAWVEWCRANSTGLIRDRARGNDYGDWLSIGADTPKDLIGTAYFAHSADLLARSLRVLGRGTEAERYERLFGEIREAFIERYVDADGRVHGDTQTAYVMALRFGLLPESLRSVAAARLVADIEARQDRISTGFVGVSHLLHVLTDAGHTDVAYRLLMQDEFPSWLFSVKHGATTIWERWNGWTPETGPHPDISMNSFNHYALGSCGRWLFESAAGIAPDPDAPGFARVIIRPRPDAALGAASATYDSIRGTIESHWTLDEDGLRMRVTVPPNVRATVWIPSDPEGRVLESGALLGEAPGVRVVGREAGCVVVEVGSGAYQFSAAVGTTRRGI